ncbi:Oidioi.mRNA.OKI2018_I69.chr2.g8289.t1.cds [Oikopleura dioica]|uniref:[histone H4]-lysine(20) N-methyltransferase n=1 Tax=Oikopleura dioica TaxID=34765 RepID=A0ABN7TB17_OIKDI|nr:Oidioi.mRNA.OKI2018_I69.chr2.g8289.t1.cds [Oikopleura dioica]
MLIDMERVEFRTRQAMNAESYFKKLVFIALNKEKQPRYANEMLSWWLGTGGIPENYLHHKTHEEQPLERDTGIESKFLNVILPRLSKMGVLKKPTQRAWLGNFDKRETLYWGDDYAAGLTYDPQSFKAIIETDVTSYSVLEIKGNPFPALPIPRPDPRTLENQLLSAARGENSYLFEGERRKQTYLPNFQVESFRWFMSWRCADPKLPGSKSSLAANDRRNHEEKEIRGAKSLKDSKSKKTAEKKKKPKKNKKVAINEAPKSPYRGPFEEMEARKSPLREIPPAKEEVKEEPKEEPKEQPEKKEAAAKEMPKLTRKPEVKVEDSARRNLNDVLKSPEPKDEKKKAKKTKPKRKVKKETDEDFEKKNTITRITDFFEVRRSNRKTSKQIEDEKDELWRDLVKSQCQEGLEIRNCPIKQRGIYSTRKFNKGDFVVEYKGDFFYPENIEESYAQESKYYEDPETGSYMYWFEFKGKKYCIDATAESPFYGRLLNHSCKTPNCATKPLDMQDPIDPVRLIIFAKEDIPAGTELLYDYGDRSKKSLEVHPWLKL